MKVSVPVFTAILATVAQGYTQIPSESAIASIQAVPAQSAPLSECSTSTPAPQPGVAPENAPNNYGPIPVENSPAAEYPPVSSAPKVSPAAAESIPCSSSDTTSTKTVQVTITLSIPQPTLSKAGYPAPAANSVHPASAPAVPSNPASGANYYPELGNVTIAAATGSVPAAAPSQQPAGSAPAAQGYPAINITAPGVPTAPAGYTSGSSKVGNSYAAFVMGLAGVIMASL